MNERNKIILLIGLIISSLSGIYLYQGYSHYTSLVDQVIQKTEEEFDSTIDSIQEFSFAPYSKRIENLITNTPDIVKAFANRDRETLYQKVLPKYEALQSENKFFQVLHFHLPDGTTFLRMHNPSFFGDDLTNIRPMIATVQQKRQALAGYEIGRHGPFYSIAQPLFFEGTYIGTLEFGIQVQELVELLEKKIDAPVTSFFREALLQKVTHSLRKNNYIQFGEFCLVTHAKEVYSSLPKNLKLNDVDQRVVIKGQTFIVHSHALFKNYNGKFVGGITALQNITSLLLQKRQFLENSAVLIVSLSIVAILALHFGFGRIMTSLNDEIANRKKAQKAATKAKREWERTVDAVPDLITILDKDFRILRTNRALAEVLKRPMSELLGHPCYQIFCGKENAPTCCPYRVLQHDKQQCCNEIYYSELGYYFEVLLSPLYDESGEFMGAVHVARNITQRKALERQIQEKHLYLESILEASTNTAIVATDDKLQIKYCNHETERLLGTPVDKLVNQPIMELHTRKNINVSTRFQKAMMEVQRHGFCQFSIQYNKHILDAQISSLTDGEGKFTGVLLMERDVTAQKNVEAKLLKAEKFEALGLMAGGVAHDLNNILSGIVSYPEVLRLGLPQDSDLQQPLLQIEKAGKRAAAVVSDLLTMARGVAHVKELISVNDLITEYLGSLEYNKISSRHPEVTVTAELDKECWSCLCSPTHILKIVMNLVTNAQEAITGTGTVLVTTHNQRKKQRPENFLTKHDFVILTVRDTGPGIPKKHLNHIFEPFYSTKKMGRSGSGLGLSILWNTVHEHGGLVTVNSDEGGTVFTVYLPASMEQLDKKESVDEPQLQTGKGTVLVIDDDKGQRAIAQKMLAVLGYTVNAVSSGEKALTWLQSNSADLLLLDMIMEPGMSGRETYEQVIQLNPKQKALIASGLSKNSDIEKAFQLGASDFLSKPYTLNELRCAVQKAMQS